MKKYISAISLLLCFTLGAGDIACIYPVILEKGKNLAEGPIKEWRVSLMPAAVPHISHRVVNGTPLDPAKKALFMESRCTMFNYWKKTLPVTPGRKYLIGAWVKNRDAKMLCWYYGMPKGAKRRYDQRIFYSVGIKKMLQPYISDSIKPRLMKSSGEWTLLYRTIQIPPNLTRLTMGYGFYGSSGILVTGSHFLIDITEKIPDERLQVKIDSARAVTTLSVHESDNNDVIWSKKFTVPVKKFQAIIPRTSFLYHQDMRGKIDGYVLTVTYADGGMKQFTAAANGSRSLY